MIQKYQWLILPDSDVSYLPGLRTTPPGCVPQRYLHPRWICDYIWSEVNIQTLPLTVDESIQLLHALDRIIREIILDNPELGPVYIMKVENIDNIPCLGGVFHMSPGEDPIIS